MPLPVSELIRRKRDGQALSDEEIRAIIAGYVSGAVPDYQMAALAMAVFFRGLEAAELAAWCDAMLRSGEVLDLSGIPGRKVDKHSTGGVGDKISLPLAPAVAIHGVAVPMIAGRGLGHTGGTLDKLESIPGLGIDLAPARFRQIVERHGFAIGGQTATLAPADRRLYALRDVTGTVESIPLIATSIMSKKLAEGIDALVLDVKVGSGAFMGSLAEARALAGTLIDLGRRAGKEVRALVTDMSQPLGRAVGNALEVREALDVLRGQGPEDTVELTVELGAEMLVLGHVAPDLAVGRSLMRGGLADGRAAERFREVVAAQGGDPDVCDRPDLLPRARHVESINAPRSGTVVAVEPRAVALAALAVGAGRRVKEDPVNPATGVLVEAKVGDTVVTGAPLFLLHHDGPGRDDARALLASAVRIAEEPAFGSPLIIERL